MAGRSTLVYNVDQNNFFTQYEKGVDSTIFSGQKVLSSFFIGLATSGVMCHVHIKMDGVWLDNQFCHLP